MNLIKLVAIGVLAGVFSVGAKERVDFTVKPVLAGKARLTEEGGYCVVRDLGAANFSPELKFPLQMIYDSASEQEGILGYGWRIPQLESSVAPQSDGVVWATPWGEKVRFYSRKDASKETLELYREEANRSKGFFAPYADWNASVNNRDGKPAECMDWTFVGKRDFEGWQFIYKGGVIRTITASSGRSLIFTYDSRNKLVSVSQDSQVFIGLSYEKNVLAGLQLNGIDHAFTYSRKEAKVLPRTLQGTVRTFETTLLSGVGRVGIAPIRFDYNAYGSLVSQSQGARTEALRVVNETAEERAATLKKAVDTKKKPEFVNARLVEDEAFVYSYDKPGEVRLVNRMGQTASYRFDIRTGIFKLTDFAGRQNTIYYFMRHDTAYLGRVRKVVDAKDRTVAEYRYDKQTGNLTRIRDRVGNDILFEQTGDGDIETVSRRGADQSDAEKILRFRYDGNRNPTEIVRLDQNGTPAVATRIIHNSENRPTQISDGRIRVSVEYNKFGYPEKVTDGFNLATRREYDAWNRLVLSVDSYGIRTEYTYNPSGLLGKVERKDGREVLTSLTVAYDAAGLPVKYTDQAGRTKGFERDAFGRVVKEFFPDDTFAEYSYNAAGQLAKVFDPNRNELSLDWNSFGLDGRTTAAAQLTDYVYDKYGLLKSMVSRKADGKTADRSIAYTYDAYDRPVKIVYGDGQTETMKYDTWGRIVETARGKKIASFEYDFFGRLVRKTEGASEETYSYDPWGQRTSRIAKLAGGDDYDFERRTYDVFGRLVRSEGSAGKLEYVYNARNQLSAQITGNNRINFTYDKYGRLILKTLGAASAPISTLRYYYGKDGQLVGRDVNGQAQRFVYDLKGQLTAVLDEQNKPIEAYRYDPAGNILEKTVDGQTTRYVYDKANQLVSSTVDGQETLYRYDAAGRLVQEGSKTYAYGYQDKILSVKENGKVAATFDYYLNGQLASVTRGSETETFYWDGLALVARGQTRYLNEPHAGGGAPVLASGKTLFNDLLGNTLGVQEGAAYTPVKMTAFGETKTKEAFFTGKPFIGELGYAFLLRNYRPNHGKWQTADPLGYPDGWNNFAYGNNRTTMGVDLYGGKWDSTRMLWYYFTGNGVPLDTDDMGLTADVLSQIEAQIVPAVKGAIDIRVVDLVRNSSGSGSATFPFSRSEQSFTASSIAWVMGGGTIRTSFQVECSWIETYDADGNWIRDYVWKAKGTFEYSDIFKDPINVGNWDPGVVTFGGQSWDLTALLNNELPGGTPYRYSHVFNSELSGKGTVYEE